MEKQPSALGASRSGRTLGALDHDRLERHVHQVQQTDIFCSTKPLCCSYLAVIFATHPVAAWQGDAGQSDAVHWAVGSLGDGELELLGVWWKSATGELHLEDVFSDFRLRGVERIRFVAGSAPVLMAEAVQTSYPLAVSIPSLAQHARQTLSQIEPQGQESAKHGLTAIRKALSSRAALDALEGIDSLPRASRNPSTAELWRLAVKQLSPVYALAPRLQRIIHRSDEATQQLSASFRRGFTTHNCISNQTPAFQPMLAAVKRMERQLAGRMFGRMQIQGPRSRPWACTT